MFKGFYFGHYVGVVTIPRAVIGKISICLILLQLIKQIEVIGRGVQ